VAVTWTTVLIYNYSKYSRYRKKSLSNCHELICDFFVSLSNVDHLTERRLNTELIIISVRRMSSVIEYYILYFDVQRSKTKRNTRRSPPLLGLGMRRRQIHIAIRTFLRHRLDDESVRRYYINVNCRCTRAAA